MQVFNKTSTLKRINRLLDSVAYTQDADLIRRAIDSMLKEIELWEE